MNVDFDTYLKKKIVYEESKSEIEFNFEKFS